MPARRPPPRQPRAAAKRASILDAVEALLARTAPSALTTTEIAAAADVPVGSIYRYFANADDAMAALFDRMNAATLAALDAEAGWPDWRAALGRLSDGVRRMHDDHPAYGALMIHLAAKGMSGGQRIPDLLADRLREGSSALGPEADLVAATVVSLFEAAEARYHRLPAPQRAAAWREGMAAVEAYLAVRLDGPGPSGAGPTTDT